MPPWDSLQIEPTADARAIKRAYAKQLKQTRPDENPQGFQQLHEAYKQALTWAEQQSSQDAPAAPLEGWHSDPLSPPVGAAPHEPVETRPEPEPEQVPGPAHTPPPSHDTFVTDPEPDETLKQASWSVQLTATPPPPIDDDPDPLDTSNDPIVSADEQDQTLAALLSQARDLVQQPTDTQQADRWHFLTRTSLILDDTFNHRLGHALFALLAEQQQSGQLSLSCPEIRYLNGLFNWEGQRRWLNEEFNQDVCDSLFRILDDTPLNQEAIKAVRGGHGVVTQIKKRPEIAPDEVAMGGYLLRMLAFSMDVFLVVVCAIFVVEALHSVSDSSDESGAPLALILAVPLYLLMALIMECSSLQSTPGKRLLGMRVTNRRLQRLHPLHNLGRILAFCITGALWKVIFILNAFMKGHLLHDRISRSYVVMHKR
ncbi:RDD family protein [Alcanivorax sp.]|jgi:uncharacterized RDD family membrane protein YckC|uniref:RDD family protein n=1 Tax=Alcanivorax sp. TaxID=1872427 RepID=UPI0032D97899